MRDGGIAIGGRNGHRKQTRTGACAQYIPTCGSIHRRVDLPLTNGTWRSDGGRDGVGAPNAAEWTSRHPSTNSRQARTPAEACRSAAGFRRTTLYLKPGRQAAAARTRRRPTRFQISGASGTGDSSTSSDGVNNITKGGIRRASGLVFHRVRLPSVKRNAVRTFMQESAGVKDRADTRRNYGESTGAGVIKRGHQRAQQYPRSVFGATAIRTAPRTRVRQR